MFSHMRMSEEISHPFIQSIIMVLNDIACNVEYKRFNMKDSANLIRRLKLITPLFEEMREIKCPLTKGALASLQEFSKALQSAERILRQCQSGSKLFLVLKRDYVASKFHEVTEQLQQALDCLPYSQLDLSDEVREQVELVHAQLKRAKSRLESPNLELYLDAMTILSQKDEFGTDSTVLRRFAEKMDLRTTADLKQESHALQNLLTSKFAKDQRSSEARIEKPNSPNVPNDFRCPISLELMKDPVIVATGQTYERACIQKWLDTGHRTCPKTQQVLRHIILTPNYVLRSLIGQWCETHGVNTPNFFGSSCAGKAGEFANQVSPGDRAMIDLLLQKLSSGQIDAQRAAAGELRILAKQSIENRVCIAEAGAIPLLISLLTSKNLGAQEHAVTALLNLSIHRPNKSHIVVAGAINPIVEVLKKGSMEARENAAATLFSLSVVDENKIIIGASGAIPALVDLLRQGTYRGKKDAATALFNLSIYQGNKARAVQAAVIPLLMQLLSNPDMGLVDEALAVLAILATHQEGQVAIGSAPSVAVLIDLITLGFPRSKENAAAILLAICRNDSAHIVAACQFGAFVPLMELASHGTLRAKRKAKALLEQMSKTGACS
ncbi:hypothetical protein O6H91_19G024100 [Diphasiastrum complanatum]|uniref:Uncharacterized protein n=1 Tax=Diphasiastrum complanatum TaxID=34168 RepID=A0ACC2ATD7_DIPCM|nr:hypothetical protein O6H91_Y052600 [Diphasiastrum complanatum]KAJ7520813.1 hypothetical protein O6H91_19G024100 [Diphasiastrum complanatum]